MADIAPSIANFRFEFFGGPYTLFVWKFILMKMTLHMMAFFHHETLGLAKRMPYPVQRRSLFRETNSVDKLAGLA